MQSSQRSYYNSLDQFKQIELLKMQIADLVSKIEAISNGPRIVLTENSTVSPTAPPRFLNSSEEVFEHCREMGSYTREVFRVIFLTTKNRVIADEIIHIGTISGCSVEVNEIFRLSSKYGATKIITVHNHPSGDSTPSDADFRLGAKIKKTAALFKITLADNLVICKESFASVVI